MGQSCARDIVMEGLLRLLAAVFADAARVVHYQIVLSVPAAVAGDVERAVVDALCFPVASPGARRQAQIAAGLGKRRGVNWGEVYRD